MANISRVGAWLRLLGWKVETNGNLLLKDSGITVMQLRVLRYLRLHPEHAQNTDIAAFFGVKHTSTIHVIKALEEKGLVCREELPHGRREKIVLTEAGRILAEQNETVTDRMEAVMLKGFSDDEKAQLLTYMKRMNDNLDKGFE